jgi:D-serine deaminase-like pyridoxal phosphate-dependent protein
MRAHLSNDTSLGPNARLLAIPGSRGALNTPCLVLDIDRLKHNIRRAATYCKERAIALRPHAKTHKCARIARLQIEAGAIGICVATIGEAEAMAAHGISDILVTSAITQQGKIERAIALAKSIHLTIVADDADVARRIGRAATQSGVEFPVLIDVDLGRHRNGIANSEQALDVAAAICASPALRLAGMQAYASHISHVESFAERKAASLACAKTIAGLKAALGAAGHRIDVVSGGSTGTLHIDPDLCCYTEMQCGSYVFSDAEYGSIDLTGAATSPFEACLFVRVSVIGRNWPGRVTCDGGNKHFSAKGTLPVFVAAPAQGAIYRPDSDEHGIIELPTDAAKPALGTSFELVVPHCDPTVNLYDYYHVVEGDTLIDIWPIEARGAF